MFFDEERRKWINKKNSWDKYCILLMLKKKRKWKLEKFILNHIEKIKRNDITEILSDVIYSHSGDGVNLANLIMSFV